MSRVACRRSTSSAFFNAEMSREIDVTYSVPPILTDWPHREAGIGTDSYFWSGFPAGTALHFSGDSSSVTATLPATLTSGFVVQVQVGRCNAKAPATLAVTLGQNLLTAVNLTACQTGTLLPYATLEIATISGTTYAVSLPVGWHFAQASTGTLTGNGTTQGVHFTIDSAAGNILITATGGCDGPQMTGLSFTQ